MMFANDIGGMRQIIGNRFPGFAEIFGGENIWFEIVIAMAVEGDVSASGCGVRSDHTRHVSIRRSARDFGHDVFPVLAAIA
jgi:hypothetical protein